MHMPNVALGTSTTTTAEEADAHSGKKDQVQSVEIASAVACK